MDRLKEAQCFSCVDNLMYQYHGSKYNGKQEAYDYIEAYQRLGEPKIKCITCDNEVIYRKEEGDKWTEVLVKASGY